jgi:hypothetical protein
MPPTEPSRVEEFAKLASTTVTVVLAAQLIWHFLPDRVTDGIKREAWKLTARARGLRQARKDQAHLMWELHQLADLCPHKLAAEVDRMASHGPR